MKFGNAGKALFWAFGPNLALIALILLWPHTPLLDGVPFSLEVRSSTGSLLRVALASDDRYRMRTRLTEVPPQLLEALILKEDRSFRFNPGVDPKAIVRAAFTRIFMDKDSGGASTLTMQVVRLKYRLDTRSLPGKAAQMALAFLMRLRHSSDEVLEAYVNLAPCGRNVEGFSAASRLYFGTELDTRNRAAEDA